MKHSHNHGSSKETFWTLMIVMMFATIIVSIVESHRDEIESSEHSGHTH